jgi:NifU-like protein involved in Fe-S cluster formation
VDYYAQVLLDEAQTPSNWGEWEATAEEHCHNASCGDTLVVRATIESGVIQSVQWHGSGCTLSRSAASVMSRAVMDQPVASVSQMGILDVQKELNIEHISPGRVKCVLLFLSCLQRQLTTEQTTKEKHE